MRLSTSLMQQLGVNAILDQQSRLSKTQLQLASGKRILTPADDPIGSAQTLDLQEEIRKHQQYQDNISMGQNRLSLEESTLAGMTDILQRVRELAVQANNSAVLKPEDKSDIAKEFQQALNELVGLANTRNANGEYLFSGTNSHTQPYPDFPTPTEGYYKYQGNDVARQLQIGSNRRMADGDPGSKIFEDITTAVIEADEIIDGTPTSAEIQKIPVTRLTAGSVYELKAGPVTLSTGPLDSDPTLTEVVTALQSDPNYSSAPFTLAEGSGDDAGKIVITWTSNGDVSTEAKLDKQDNAFSFIDQFIKSLNGDLPEEITTDSLYALDNALEHLNNTRASVGARLNAADQQYQVNEQFVIEMKGTLSKIQDLDYAEAIGHFNLQQVGLQAAQQAFIKVQNLSLFNFLR